MKEPVTLGDCYRDEVTGYEGIATARAVYLGDELPRVRLESVVDGRPVSEWWDEPRLQPVATQNGRPC